MPQFNPELIQVMKDALEAVMLKVPVEYATPTAKAYLAECILKAAAEGRTSLDELIAAAAGRIDMVLALVA